MTCILSSLFKLNNSGLGHSYRGVLNQHDQMEGHSINYAKWNVSSEFWCFHSRDITSSTVSSLSSGPGEGVIIIAMRSHWRYDISTGRPRDFSFKNIGNPSLKPKCSALLARCVGTHRQLVEESVIQKGRWCQDKRYWTFHSPATANDNIMRWLFGGI